MNNKPEVWLRGPLDDIPVLLQPVAHAILQAGEEVTAIMRHFPGELLWQKPAGLASPAFHLQHIPGVIDRLFTYASGEQLDQQQLNYLSSENKLNKLTVDELVIQFNNQVNNALQQLAKVDELTLTDARGVGRAKLPSTVIGLYVHAAEHTMRHVGQLLVTVKVLRAGEPAI